MKANYHVYEIKKVIVDGEDTGGDAEYIGTYSKEKAIKMAKKISLNKYCYDKKTPLHEVMVICDDPDGNDPIYQAYFKKGGIGFNMGF